MNTDSFYKLLKAKFPHNVNAQQDIVLMKLSEFIFDKTPNALYILKGFAGTGKTTIIGTMVTHLWHTKTKAILMAPTGRAAKVISNYSQKEAFTIHKKIYFPKKSRGGGVNFVLQPNKYRNTIFIVDEASMISDIPNDSKNNQSASLLDDLMQFVYSGHQCKLLLIGDKAQLPPIHAQTSPALDHDKIDLNYNKRVSHLELDEVVRQSEFSGILSNATLIREALGSHFYESFQFNLSNYKDIIRLQEGNEIMNAIGDAFSDVGHEETAIIVRSNKRANLYNQNIRDRILFKDAELCAGDFLMVVKNNYFWVKPTSEASFIANGDIIEILEIFSIKDLFGFRFAEVKVQMVDYPKMKPFETVLLLDTIHAETPSLSYEDSNRLYQEIQKDYEHETSSYRKFLKIKSDKFFNALQVKFSYAITCHKSQGGQWDRVFIEQPYLPNGINEDYLRWLYTAVTRAKETLYLIGFKNEFFVND